jgi:hypothetical protein
VLAGEVGGEVAEAGFKVERAMAGISEVALWGDPEHGFGLLEHGMGDAEEGGGAAGGVRIDTEESEATEEGIFPQGVGVDGGVAVVMRKGALGEVEADKGIPPGGVIQEDNGGLGALGRGGIDGQSEGVEMAGKVPAGVEGKEAAEAPRQGWQVGRG